MPNSDERRAKALILDKYWPSTLEDSEKFEERWLAFIKQKSHYGTPETVVQEFLDFLNP